MCIYMWVCKYVGTSVYIHVCMCRCMFVYVCVYVCFVFVTRVLYL